MEHLLLVTSCDSPAGIGASLRTHVRTNGLTDGWTDRRDVGNSILDLNLLKNVCFFEMERNVISIFYVVEEFSSLKLHKS